MGYKAALAYVCKKRTTAEKTLLVCKLFRGHTDERERYGIIVSKNKKNETG